MNYAQWIIYLVIVLLLFIRASKYDAFVLFVAFSVYQVFIIPVSDIYYYSCTSLLNLCVGIVLHHRNRLAALCSYSLVLLNLIGFWMWYAMFNPTVYDNISLFILTIQLFAIIPKGLVNGIRHYFKHTMAHIVGFDCFQSRATIHKTKDEKIK